CANRIGGARFTLDGREHALTANEGRNHLHGGARGFERRAWEPLRSTGAGVALHLESPDGDEGYPGGLAVTALWALDAGAPGAPAMLALVLDARADAPTPCNLAEHSYFNLAG